MPTASQTKPPLRQLPALDEVYLDHVGHFVADPHAATAALIRAGFAPTPVSLQVNPDPAGGPPKLTGTGNVCAMLRAGYVEVLFKTADTPLGQEFEVARSRYNGLHLVAFAVADAAAQHARLSAAGFAMQPLVRMQRPVETASGPGTAAFEVVRVKADAMPEGRVQMLLHRTEETVWQPRWLDHPNGAKGLAGLTIVAADVAEATARFTRFTDRDALLGDDGSRIQLDRGWLDIITPQAWQRRWPGIPAPTLPFLGECTIEVASLATAERVLRDGGLQIWLSQDGFSVPFPDELGIGLWTFVAAPAPAT